MDTTPSSDSEESSHSNVKESDDWLHTSLHFNWDETNEMQLWTYPVKLLNQTTHWNSKSSYNHNEKCKLASTAQTVTTLSFFTRPKTSVHLSWKGTWSCKRSSFPPLHSLLRWCNRSKMTLFDPHWRCGSGDGVGLFDVKNEALQAKLSQLVFRIKLRWLVEELVNWKSGVDHGRGGKIECEECGKPGRGWEIRWLGGCEVLRKLSGRRKGRGLQWRQEQEISFPFSIWSHPHQSRCSSPALFSSIEL